MISAEIIGRRLSQILPSELDGASLNFNGIPMHIIDLTDSRGQFYAWGRTARYICEEDYLQALRDTKGPFLALDLCSAFPIWPQILRERHRTYCFDVAGRLVGQAVGDFANAHRHLSEGEQLPAALAMDRGLRKQVSSVIERRHSDFRILLQAGVHEVLMCELGENSEGIEVALTNRFLGSPKFYQKIFELEKLVGRGRWEIVVARWGEKTAFQELSRLTSESLAKGLLLDFAQVLTTKAKPLLREHKVVSLDMEDPEVLLHEGQNSFPDYFMNTVFFARASDLSTAHIQADVLSIDQHFAPKSVKFMSSIEGIPYYFKGLPFSDSPDGRDYRSFADSVATLLGPGGRAIFFPWQVNYENRYDQQNLAQTVRYWQDLGMKTEFRRFTRGELKAQMRGDREQSLTYRSPLFRSRQRVFRALMLEKPGGIKPQLG